MFVCVLPRRSRSWHNVRWGAGNKTWVSRGPQRRCGSLGSSWNQCWRYARLCARSLCGFDCWSVSIGGPTAAGMAGGLWRV